MIYLTSDIHNDIEHPGLNEYIKKSTKDDILIILGDVGLRFPEKDCFEEFEKEFLAIKTPIAFIDGNHENEEYLSSLPVETLYGGSVHRVSENIVHLMRGNVYNIQGKTFFAMGGCRSSEKWWSKGLASIKDEPSEDEVKLGYESLAKCKNKVDYIITHNYDANGTPENANTLLGITQYIDKNVDFSMWFCGHWHREEEIDGKHRILYKSLTALD